MRLGMPVLYEFDCVEDNMILAQQLGLDFLEMNLNFSYCRTAMEDPQELKRLMDKYNLDITLHFYDEADFGSYTEVAEAYYGLLERYLKLGKEVDLKMVNVHLIDGPVVTISGIKNYIYEKEFDTYIERLGGFLKKVDVLCKEYGVKLVIENSKVVPYMEKTYQYLAQQGFRFNFDIGHDNNNGDIVLDISKRIDMKFDEFHIHDANRKTDHLCLGLGDVDIKYFKNLAIKNNAYVVLEVKSSEDLIKSVEIFRNL